MPFACRIIGIQYSSKPSDACWQQDAVSSLESQYPTGKLFFPCQTRGQHSTLRPALLAGGCGTLQAAGSPPSAALHPSLLAARLPPPTAALRRRRLRRWLAGGPPVGARLIARSRPVSRLKGCRAVRPRSLWCSPRSVRRSTRSLWRSPKSLWRSPALRGHALLTAGLLGSAMRVACMGVVAPGGLLLLLSSLLGGAAAAPAGLSSTRRSHSQGLHRNCPPISGLRSRLRLCRLGCCPAALLWLSCCPAVLLRISCCQAVLLRLSCRPAALLRLSCRLRGQARPLVVRRI